MPGELATAAVHCRPLPPSPAGSRLSVTSPLAQQESSHCLLPSKCHVFYSLPSSPAVPVWASGVFLIEPIYLIGPCSTVIVDSFCLSLSIAHLRLGNPTGPKEQWSRTPQGPSAHRLKAQLPFWRVRACMARLKGQAMVLEPDPSTRLNHMHRVLYLPPIYCLCVCTPD